MLAIPFIGFIVTSFSKALKNTMLQARASLADLNGFTQECLYGSSTVKLLTAEADVKKKFHQKNEVFRKDQMKSVTLDASMFSIIDGLTSIIVGLILYVSLTFFTGQSFLSAGLLVAFIQYTQQMFEPIKQLSNKIAMLQGAFTSIERIFSVLDQTDLDVGGKEVPP